VIREFKKIITLLSLFGVCITFASQAQELSRIESVKIWDRAPHNAFTDLVRFQNRWFCVFREGDKHVSPDGALRVITSTDGDNWESAALLTKDDADLRDAKISVTPRGQLMLSGAGAMHDKSEHTHQSFAWFSDDGYTWIGPFETGDPDFWLWRTTWHNGNDYGIGYGCNHDRWIRLYTSVDGKSYRILVDHLFDQGYANESCIVFKGDTAFCLLRRDGDLNTGMIGTSFPPYTQWHWRDLGVRIGGPEMIVMKDGSLLAAVRLYNNRQGQPVHTALCAIDPFTGTLEEKLALPSGGDTSYAGMQLFGNRLWVSYYSSHEKKTSIYLAKVAIDFLQNSKK